VARARRRSRNLTPGVCDAIGWGMQGLLWGSASVLRAGFGGWRAS
jgi:hypothetical protein